MNTNKDGKAESYLTFKIDTEIFATNVTYVISILELIKITKIPRTPDYIKGVINLRGTVLPVIDMKLKFGLPAIEYTNNTSILVLEVKIDNEVIKVGALVDSVLEVLEIRDSEILPAPTLGNKFRSDIMDGIYKSEDALIMLLNMEKFFTEDELTTIGSDLLFQEDKQAKE
jgi:purine-binding chemotaxis protein CheW